MPSELAFNWHPGVLEWLVVLELVLLLVLGGYRYIASLLGKSSPTDAFVIFYRVFWRAFRTPKAYPIPVNYQPVPPKRAKPKLEDIDETAGLTDEEIEALMSDSLAGGAAPARGDGEQPDAIGAESVLDVLVVTAMAVGIRSVTEGVMTVGVNVAPDDGRANRIVMEQVCTVLQLKSHQVALKAGHTRAAKTLKITGLRQSELDQRLAELGEAPGETIGFAGHS